MSSGAGTGEEGRDGAEAGREGGEQDTPGNPPGGAESSPAEDGSKLAGEAEEIPNDDNVNADVSFVPYKDENDMRSIVELIEKDLSEPYSIFTYRYFINNWPELCFLTMRDGTCVGAIVCKLDVHRCRSTNRGYIAMLAVDKSLRGKGIGSKLVKLCLDRMREMGADECVLETEVTNTGALGLYRNMGFVKEKRLHKYYLNGNDAYRLKFLFKLPEGFDKGEGCLGPPVIDFDPLAQPPA
mmetsp:Transcript_71822/g.163006  ORF Transcript_71822/g.163006 Transcript_71822/m.163006 type:complete len:240 (-) Transcript_71822:128-847(-)